MARRPASGADDQVLRLCLDVNVLVSAAFAKQRGRTGGASSRIVSTVRDGVCALGPVQLVISWRMLTTLHVVLRTRLAIPDSDASLVCDALAGTAEAGPLGTSPLVVLGGTGLLPMADEEDAGVAETALAGRANLLVTHDLCDFEGGPRSRLPTRRVLSDEHGRPVALIVEDALRGSLLAAAPEVAVGWLRGQTALPAEFGHPHPSESGG